VRIQSFASTAAGAVEKTSIGKSVKEGIDHFFEGMPVFMNALDAVADLHPCHLGYVSSPICMHRK
jgi:hypothetical protein